VLVPSSQKRKGSPSHPPASPSPSPLERIRGRPGEFLDDPDDGDPRPPQATPSPSPSVEDTADEADEDEDENDDEDDDDDGLPFQARLPPPPPHASVASTSDTVEQPEFRQYELVSEPDETDLIDSYTIESTM
jgi:hypothetical protein